MATILQFRALSEKPRKPRSRRRRRSAEIVIFPGVRYERSPEQQPQSMPASVPAKRDALQLAE